MVIIVGTSCKFLKTILQKPLSSTHFNLFAMEGGDKSLQESRRAYGTAVIKIVFLLNTVVGKDWKTM